MKEWFGVPRVESEKCEIVQPFPTVALSSSRFLSLVSTRLFISVPILALFPYILFDRVA